MKVFISTYYFFWSLTSNKTRILNVKSLDACIPLSVYVVMGGGADSGPCLRWREPRSITGSAELLGCAWDQPWTAISSHLTPAYDRQLRDEAGNSIPLTNAALLSAYIWDRSLKKKDRKQVRSLCRWEMFDLRVRVIMMTQKSTIKFCLNLGGSPNCEGHQHPYPPIT